MGVDDVLDVYFMLLLILGFIGGLFDGSSKFVSGLVKRVVIFYNVRFIVVLFYWVDFDGNEVYYVDVYL